MTKNFGCAVQPLMSLRGNSSMEAPSISPQPTAAAGGEVRRVPIEQIAAGERLRPLQAWAVSDLAGSIQHEGLLNPITVRPVGDGYKLVAGHHRLEAVKQIGLTHIAAMVMEIDANEALLIEINENLIRADLSVLVQAEHLRLAKQIHEARNPESARVGRRAKNAGTVPTFSKVAAIYAGKDESTIRQYIRIASRLTDEVRDLIRPTALSNQTRQLDQLSRCTNPGMQLEIAKVLVSGEAKTVAAARRLLEAEIQPASADGGACLPDACELGTPSEGENGSTSPVEPGDTDLRRDVHGSEDPREPTPSIRHFIDHAFRALSWNDISKDQFIAIMACLARPHLPVSELHTIHVQWHANLEPLLSIDDLESAANFVAHPPVLTPLTSLDLWMDDHGVPRVNHDPSNPDDAFWGYGDEPVPKPLEEPSPESLVEIQPPRQVSTVSEWMPSVLPDVQIDDDNAQRLWEKSGRNWRLLAAALIVARDFERKERLLNPGGFIYRLLDDSEKTKTRASRLLEKHPTWAADPLLRHAYTDDELVWVIGNICGRWRDLPDLPDEQAAALLDVADGDFGHVLDAIQGIYWRSKQKAVPDPVGEIRQVLALEAREVEAMGREARHFAGQPGIEHLDVPTLGSRLLAERGLQRRDIWNYWDEESNPDRDKWGTELAAQLTRYLHKRERDDTSSCGSHDDGTPADIEPLSVVSAEVAISDMEMT